MSLCRSPSLRVGSSALHGSSKTSEHRFAACVQTRRSDGCTQIAPNCRGLHSLTGWSSGCSCVALSRRGSPAKRGSLELVRAARLHPVHTTVRKAVSVRGHTVCTECADRCAGTSFRCTLHPGPEAVAWQPLLRPLDALEALRRPFGVSVAKCSTALYVQVNRAGNAAWGARWTLQPGSAMSYNGRYSGASKHLHHCEEGAHSGSKATCGGAGHCLEFSTARDEWSTGDTRTMPVAPGHG